MRLKTMMIKYNLDTDICGRAIVSNQLFQTDKAKSGECVFKN